MATTTGSTLTADAVSSLQAVQNRRRRIPPEAGRALEILGHAIEYLTDEFVSGGGELRAHKGEIDALQLLMAKNRQIYFACPIVPSIRDRFQAFLHSRHF
jgi:hypothetical protein